MSNNSISENPYEPPGESCQQINSQSQEARLAQYFRIQISVLAGFWLIYGIVIGIMNTNVCFSEWDEVFQEGDWSDQRRLVTSLLAGGLGSMACVCLGFGIIWEKYFAIIINLVVCYLILVGLFSANKWDWFFVITTFLFQTFWSHATLLIAKRLQNRRTIPPPRPHGLG